MAASLNEMESKNLLFVLALLHFTPTLPDTFDKDGIMNRTQTGVESCVVHPRVRSSAGHVQRLGCARLEMMILFPPTEMHEG